MVVTTDGSCSGLSGGLAIVHDKDLSTAPRAPAITSSSPLP